MTNYRVKLDIYQGPLDLLLYLIRRDELDIHDIPIAKVTGQYLEYVELIKTLNIDAAGDFLVMAATLMEIKSAFLLPRVEAEGTQDEDLMDPRQELVRQLLEYKKFKDIASHLGQSAREQAGRYPRSIADLEKLRELQRHQREFEMESLQIWDLFEAFNQLVKATLAGQGEHGIIHDDTPIDLYEIDILDRAQQEKALEFKSVFGGCKARVEMMGLFLALLELIRQKLVRIEQEQAFGPIYIFALTELPAAEAVGKAISGEVSINHALAAEQQEQNFSEASPQTETSQERIPQGGQD